MTTGINGASGTGQATMPESETEETPISSTDKKIKSIQVQLLDTAIGSIKANDAVMELYTRRIEDHSESVSKSTNLLTYLEDLSSEGFELLGETDAEKVNQEKIVEVVSNMASAAGVTVPESLKKCIEDFKAEGSDGKLSLNKDQLGRLKTLCKSISDRVGKLETQDQMRLNQAQSDHANTIKWIINVLNSIQSMMDKIIQMGERR